MITMPDTRAEDVFVETSVAADERVVDGIHVERGIRETERSWSNVFVSVALMGWSTMRIVSSSTSMLSTPVAALTPWALAVLSTRPA